MVVFRGKQLRGGRALAPALSGAHTAGGNKHACHERGLANPAQLGSPSLRPQEIKPNLGMIMNDLSILLATARHLDEPLNARNVRRDPVIASSPIAPPPRRFTTRLLAHASHRD